MRAPPAKPGREQRSPQTEPNSSSAQSPGVGAAHDRQRGGCMTWAPRAHRCQAAGLVSD